MTYEPPGWETCLSRSVGPHDNRVRSPSTALVETYFCQAAVKKGIKLLTTSAHYQKNLCGFYVKQDEYVL